MNRHALFWFKTVTIAQSIDVICFSSVLYSHMSYNSIIREMKKKKGEGVRSLSSHSERREKKYYEKFYDNTITWVW